ncbi:MAG: T9SS type A sorting domain-containing protein [Muribaculaceae bacterium]|nr:T9SS type A sorting domain-containing protein [Muribaculaceae bacterium]
MVYVPAGVSSAVDEMVSEEDSVVDVYNMQGMVVKSRVDSSAALDGLRPGVYIVGGKKVLVR